MTVGRAVEILLVEDNEGDVELTREALRESKIQNRLSVVGNGEDALAYLHREGRYGDATEPDVILLDLNLPRLSGQEVLAEIKGDDRLKRIPVVILTTSRADEDIVRSYNLHANCYITKPVDFDQFTKVVQTIEDFWFTIVRLPPREIG